MSEFMWVKLAEGKRVRDPLSQSIMLPEKVYKVRKGQFWLRRVESCDVIACEAPKAEIVESEKPKALSKKKEKSGEI